MSVPDNSGMPTPREEVLELVESLVGLPLSKLHICVTSRPEIDIQHTLEPLEPLRVSLHTKPDRKKTSWILSRRLCIRVGRCGDGARRTRGCHRDALRESRRDVRGVLFLRLDKISYFHRFRWAYCQLEELRHALSPSLRKTLERLAQYARRDVRRVLREINEASREHALCLLQCLAVAHRPLRVEELAEVLAIDLDGFVQRRHSTAEP